MQTLLFFAGFCTQTVHFLGFELLCYGKLLKSSQPWCFQQSVLKMSALLSRSVMSDSLETPWTVAHQAPLSMGFSRQEYWSGLPCPPPGDLPNPGIEPRSPEL